MNDTRDQVFECAGKRGSCAYRCDGGKPRRGGAMVAVYAGVFTALFSAGVVGRGKKQVEAAPVVPAVAAAGVAASVAGGGGGVSGGAGESAADARERMEVDGSKMVKASLLFSEKVKLPGAESSLGTLAVAFDIEKGWHTYWRNAGDSGMPPTFEFTVEPAGAVEIGEAQWAVPKRHVAEGDIVDYIYEGRVLHLFEVKPGPKSVGKGEVTITCKASWLVCKEACLPGEGEAKTTILFSNREQPESDVAAEIEAWSKRLPLDAEASKVFLQHTWCGKSLVLRGGVREFFPFAEEELATPTSVHFEQADWAGKCPAGMNLVFDDADLGGTKHVRGIAVIRSTAQGVHDETKAYTLDLPLKPQPSVAVPATPRRE